MKKLFILSSLAVLLVGNLAHAWCNMKPTFENDYIKMKGKRFLPARRCGKVTISPIALSEGSLITLKTQKMKQKREGFRKTPVSDKVTARNVSLKDAGMRVAYDRADSNCKSHWRIYCYRTKIGAFGATEGATIQVDCKANVRIEDIKHPRACIFEKTGPEGEFYPLNMYSDAPEV